MNTNKNLNIQAFLMLAVGAGLLLAGEMGWMPQLMPGTVTYAMQLLVVVLTLAAVPLALKMMSTQWLRSKINGDEQAYFNWASIRLRLLMGVILTGVLVYNFIQDTSMLFCAGVGLISLMYIWPTQSRQESELEASKTEE